jgi:glutamine amidotransferase
MIGVIDYGASNLRSVMHALHHLGVDAHVADHPGGLRGADAIILPGVGAFGAGMAQIRARGFEDPVRRAAAEGLPLLGICLGMQFLFEVSKEMGEYSGLGLLGGRVQRFPEDRMGGLKVPPWAGTSSTRRATRPCGRAAGGRLRLLRPQLLLCAVRPGRYVATTDLRLDFTWSWRGANVYGVQFHPEKSQAVACASCAISWAWSRRRPPAADEPGVMPAPRWAVLS